MVTRKDWSYNHAAAKEKAGIGLGGFFSIVSGLVGGTLVVSSLTIMPFLIPEKVLFFFVIGMLLCLAALLLGK